MTTYLEFYKEEIEEAERTLQNLPKNLKELFESETLVAMEYSANRKKSESRVQAKRTR